MEYKPAGDRRYHYIIENIRKLPSLPQVVTRLLTMVNSPYTSADDIAALIEKDPALTSSVIRWLTVRFMECREVPRQYQVQLLFLDSIQFVQLFSVPRL